MTAGALQVKIDDLLARLKDESGVQYVPGPRAEYPSRRRARSAVALRDRRRADAGRHAEGASRCAGRRGARA